MARVSYTIQQCVFLLQTCFKCESARKCRTKFRCQFPGQPVPSRQIIHYLVNKLTATGSLVDKKPDRKRTVLTEEKFDESGARLETSPRKSLRRLVQETRVSKTSARRATKLLQLRPYKTRTVHALKPLHSGRTKKQHPPRDCNNFRGRISES
jgi:hypothetical protein